MSSVGAVPARASMHTANDANLEFSHSNGIELSQEKASTPNANGTLTFVGVDGHKPGNSTIYSGLHKRNNQNASAESPTEEPEAMPQYHYPHYLTPLTTGRNAQFFGLSKAEREHLGGVEYRAISLLSWIVPIYFALWQVLGCLGLGAYMAYNKADTARGNGINPW